MIIKKALYFEDEDLVSIDYDFNQVFNERVKKIGFYFDRDKNKWVANFCEFYLYFIEQHAHKNIKYTQDYLNLKRKHEDTFSFYKGKKEREHQSNHNYSGLSLPVKEHQMMAIDLMTKTPGGYFLNDGFGTGKTLISSTFCQMNNYKTVVFCPKEHVYFWEKELDRYFLNTEDRALFRVISFGKMSRDEDLLKSLRKEKYEAVIVDEAHRLTNTSSKMFRNIYKISKKAQYVIAATGKDFSQEYLDLFPILKLINKETNNNHYMKKYFEYEFIPGKGLQIHGVKIGYLLANISRYTSRTLLSDIKETQENYHIIHVKRVDHKKYLEVLENHEFRFDRESVVDINHFLSKSKLTTLIRTVVNFRKENPDEVVVVASQFRDILEKAMMHLDYSCIYGPDFDENSGYKVVLLDTSLYREGFNLSFAHNLILLDLYDDKSKNDQVKHRINRLLQKNPVNYFLLETDEMDKMLRLIPRGVRYDQLLKLLQKRLFERNSRLFSDRKFA